MPKKILKKQPKLVLPAVKYKASFLRDFLSHEELLDEYNNLTGIPKSKVKNQFSEFVKKLKAQSLGVFSKKRLVPQTVFWLVKGNIFLGRLSIRHYLNANLRKVGGHIGYYISLDQRLKGYGKEMLRLALPKAKKLGIKNVLVTCDETNIGSRKIIEANGGQFLSKTNMGKGLPKKLRYEIKL